MQLLTDAQVYALCKSASGNLMDYDAAGNRVSDRDGYLYSYDHENRIVKIEKGDGDATPTVVAEFAYDTQGRRIRTISYASVPAAATLYYYSDNWQVLSEYDDSDLRQRLFVYGNYIEG